MGLSIVQRIIAGFVLMLLLLVLLGFISILKIRGSTRGSPRFLIVPPPW